MVAQVAFDDHGSVRDQGVDGAPLCLIDQRAGSYEQTQLSAFMDCRVVVEVMCDAATEHAGGPCDQYVRYGFSSANGLYRTK